MWSWTWKITLQNNDWPMKENISQNKPVAFTSYLILPHQHPSTETVPALLTVLFQEIVSSKLMLVRISTWKKQLESNGLHLLCQFWHIWAHTAFLWCKQSKTKPNPVRSTLPPRPSVPNPLRILFISVFCLLSCKSCPASLQRRKKSLSTLTFPVCIVETPACFGFLDRVKMNRARLAECSGDGAVERIHFPWLLSADTYWRLHHHNTRHNVASGAV